jgi:hypothetical protein
MKWPIVCDISSQSHAPDIGANHLRSPRLVLAKTAISTTATKIQFVQASLIPAPCREGIFLIWRLTTRLSGCFGETGCIAATCTPHARNNAASAKAENGMLAKSA